MRAALYRYYIEKQKIPLFLVYINWNSIIYTPKVKF
jgi:hypothetical protein